MTQEIIKIVGIEVQMPYHNEVYIVGEKPEGARFVLRNNEFELEITFINNNNKRMEVLGNVYENPELMEEVR